MAGCGCLCQDVGEHPQQLQSRGVCRCGRESSHDIDPDEPLLLKSLHCRALPFQRFPSKLPSVKTLGIGLGGNLGPQMRSGFVTAQRSPLHTTTANPEPTRKTRHWPRQVLYFANTKTSTGAACGSSAPRTLLVVSPSALRCRCPGHVTPRANTASAEGLRRLWFWR